MLNNALLERCSSLAGLKKWQGSSPLMQGRALVILTFWCLNISDECSNCCVFPSPSLSLPPPHTHIHTHIWSLVYDALAEQSSFTLIHTHTDIAFPCLWQEVFCRLSEESSLLLPPAGNTNLFIDQGLAGWRERERTERARDEEKREKGEKMLQLWSKCCTEPLCVMGNVTVNGSTLSFIYTARVILFPRHRFWPVLS